MRKLMLCLSLLSPLAGAQERFIHKEVVVKASLAQAWDAWATSEGIQSFFAPEARIEARPDGAYALHFNPYAPPGARGADDMRVLAVQPQRMISFTWNAPPHLPQARGQRTVVIVRTAEAGEGRTRVSLSHLGWGSGGEWDLAYEYFDAAWGRVLANLEKRFVDGPVDWSARLKQLRDATPR